MTTTATPERAAVARAQQAMLDAAAIPIAARRVELASGPTLEVLEGGEGEPLLLWHGSGVNALSLVPLMERLPDRRVIAPHRPGYGLSDPISYDRQSIRERSVRIVEQVLDAYGLGRADFVGNSTGGLWSLWTALDRPERVGRIVLAGVTPLLPGTQPPVPLRLMSTPGLGTLLGKVMPDPSPKSVRAMMTSMGEGDTIGGHPRLVDVMVAAGADPIAGQVAGEELSSMIRGLAGFRPQHRISAEALARVTNPVLLLWGTGDPVDAGTAVEQVAAALPAASVEVLEAGHAPWLGDPQDIASRVMRFLEA